MCLACSDWLKGKMTSEEALRAVGELLQSEDGNEDHYLSVVSKILDKEVPTREYNPEIDGAWESKHRK